jgi:phosphopantothenoylcysteine synthetase/decarboxylase
MAKTRSHQVHLLGTSGRPVAPASFERPRNEAPRCREADATVAPATANFLAKAALGIADDLFRRCC